MIPSLETAKSSLVAVQIDVAHQHQNMLHIARRNSTESAQHLTLR